MTGASAGDTSTLVGHWTDTAGVVGLSLGSSVLSFRILSLLLSLVGNVASWIESATEPCCGIRVVSESRKARVYLNICANAKILQHSSHFLKLIPSLYAKLGKVHLKYNLFHRAWVGFRLLPLSLKLSFQLTEGDSRKLNTNPVLLMCVALSSFRLEREMPWGIFDWKDRAEIH